MIFLLFVVGCFASRVPEVPLGYEGYFCDAADKDHFNLWFGEVFSPQETFIDLEGFDEPPRHFQVNRTDSNLKRKRDGHCPITEEVMKERRGHIPDAASSVVELFENAPSKQIFSVPENRTKKSPRTTLKYSPRSGSAISGSFTISSHLEPQARGSPNIAALAASVDDLSISQSPVPVHRFTWEKPRMPQRVDTWQMQINVSLYPEVVVVTEPAETVLVEIVPESIPRGLSSTASRPKEFIFHGTKKGTKLECDEIPDILVDFQNPVRRLKMPSGLPFAAKVPLSLRRNCCFLMSFRERRVFWLPRQSERLFNMFDSYDDLLECFESTVKVPELSGYFIPTIIAQYLIPSYFSPQSVTVTEFTTMKALFTQTQGRPLAFYYKYLQQAAFFATGRVSPHLLLACDPLLYITNHLCDTIGIPFDRINNYGQLIEDNIRLEAQCGNIHLLNILQIGIQWGMLHNAICEGALSFLRVYGAHLRHAENTIRLAKYILENPTSIQQLPVSITGIARSFSQLSPIEVFDIYCSELN